MGVAEDVDVVETRRVPDDVLRLVQYILGPQAHIATTVAW